MRIGFIVNDVKTEEGNFTTSRLGQAAVNRGHEVWTIGVGDVAYDPDDMVRARATSVPKQKYGSSESYTADLRGKNAVKRRIAIDELDVCMSEHLLPAARHDRDRMSRVLIGKIDNQELRFPLFKKRLTIGRTQHNDIQLQAPHISRRHAVVMTEGDVTRVIDWGSKNGVYVNSSRVTEHFLASGDVVMIGDAKFRYEERPKRDSSSV